MPETSGISEAVTSVLTEEKRKSGKKQELGQDEFLKLLTTQLKAQDPLKPVEDTQFIAQMAQFSSLQQTQMLNKNFEKFNKTVQDSATMQTLAEASVLIGKVVTAGPSMLQRSMGEVKQVRLEDGNVKIILKGVDYNGNVFSDKKVDMNQLLQVGISPDEVRAFEEETRVNTARSAAGGIALPGAAGKIPENFSRLPDGSGVPDLMTPYR
jgi:flagellar basal-body rod modification protein FlgD